MPYKSMRQMRYMHARHPALAKRWDKEYGAPKNLPERKRKLKHKRSKASRRLP